MGLEINRNTISLSFSTPNALGILIDRGTAFRQELRRPAFRGPVAGPVGELRRRTMEFREELRRPLFTERRRFFVRAGRGELTFGAVVGARAEQESRASASRRAQGIVFI